MVHMAEVPERYQLSFTFGGLLIPETRAIAAAYRAHAEDWQLVRAAVVERNLLSKTRTASSRRYFREIRYRLGHAYHWELDVIAGSSPAPSDADVPVVLFALFTRYYRLVGDFMTEVVRPRLFSGLPTIDAAMFRTFMGDQSRVHPELTGIADSTAEKLTSVALRTLAEAGIITGRRGPFTVTPPQLSAGLRERYCAHGTTADLTHLLWTDQEIRPCLR